MKLDTIICRAKEAIRAQNIYMMVSYICLQQIIHVKLTYVFLKAKKTGDTRRKALIFSRILYWDFCPRLVSGVLAITTTLYSCINYVIKINISLILQSIH